MSFFLFIVLPMPLLLVYSHPINMICVPVCNSSISANKMLINNWLSNNNSTGIDQLLNKDGTVTERLLRLSSTENNDCSKKYNSLLRVSVDTENVSVDLIMEFFNAYFVHRLFAEHLMRFSVNELLLKDWVKQANVGKLFEELEKLHYILECNLKDLAIMLNINGTCDTCKRNCSRTAEVMDYFVNAMNNCSSPIHHFIVTVVGHSHKLSQTLNKLKETITNSDDIQTMDVTSHDDISIDELCWCGQ